MSTERLDGMLAAVPDTFDLCHTACKAGRAGVSDRQGAYIDVEGFIPRGFGGRDRIAVLDETLDGFHFHSHE